MDKSELIPIDPEDLKFYQKILQHWDKILMVYPGGRRISSIPSEYYLKYNDLSSDIPEKIIIFFKKDAVVMPDFLSLQFYDQSPEKISLEIYQDSTKEKIYPFSD